MEKVEQKIKINTKELSLVKSQVNKVTELAQSLIIKEKKDLDIASNILTKIKEIGNLIKQKKESITKPLNEALKNARELFYPIEREWAEAERIVKQKMIDYHKNEEMKALKKEEKIAKQVDAGKISFEKAVEKINKIDRPENNIGNVTFRIIKKFEVVDISKLPLEYHLPNEAKIREAMYKGIELEGVRYWEEKIAAVKYNEK